MAVRNGQYKLSVEKRITKLEVTTDNLSKEIGELKDTFEKFMTNHFEHFKDDMSSALNNVETKLSKKIDDSKGIPMSVTVLISLLSTIVTGLVMWVVTH